MIEGRDIGTVVFPDATLKLFVTASPRVRAERRVAELGGDVDDVAASIAERDRRDMSRADGPLRAADGAAVVDTTGLTIDEVVERIIELLPADAPMTEVETFLAGQGRGQPGALLRRPGRRRRVHPAVDAHDASTGASTSRRRARSCSPRCTARTWTRRSRRA